MPFRRQKLLCILKNGGVSNWESVCRGGIVIRRTCPWKKRGVYMWEENCGGVGEVSIFWEYWSGRLCVSSHFMLTAVLPFLFGGARLGHMSFRSSMRIHQPGRQDPRRCSPFGSRARTSITSMEYRQSHSYAPRSCLGCVVEQHAATMTKTKLEQFCFGSLVPPCAFTGNPKAGARHHHITVY